MRDTRPLTLLTAFAAAMILAGAMAANVIAEETAPFFDKDFAKSPGQDGEAEPVKPAPTPPAKKEKEPPREEETDPVKKAVKDASRAARDAAAGVPSKKTPSTSPQQMKVVVVGAILDSTSRETLISDLSDMLQVLGKSRILISTIYAIGPRHEIPQKIQYEITKLQGRIIFRDEPPEKYNMVRTSPSWIISSLDQEIIIEGAGPLSENLTSKGEIISKAQRF